MIFKTWKELEIRFPKLKTLRTSYVWKEPQINSGWFDLIAELMEKLEYLGLDKNLEIQQVKEKFGGLRFYCNGITKECFDIIHKFEEKSYIICETCGEIGTLREYGWYKVRCDRCEYEYKQGFTKRQLKILKEFNDRNNIKS